MATASDDFTRANETPLAGNWSAYGGGGTVNKWNLSSNTAVAPNPTTDDCNAYWNANTFGADQFSQAQLTVTAGGGSGQGVGLVVRTDHAAQAPAGTDKHTHYRFVADHNAASNIDISRFNAGVHSNLKTVTQAWSNGDTWRMEITGYVITLKLNGAVVTTFDDSASGSKIATGQVGISNSTNDTSPSLDNWSGGDLDVAGGTPVRIVPMMLRRMRPFRDNFLTFPVPQVSAAGPLTFNQPMDGTAVLVTASMQRQVNKLATATAVVVTASMLRLVGKLMTATSSVVTASMVKQVNKLLTATSVVVTASMAAIKVILRTLTATTVGVTATMVRQVNKPLLATSLALTASIVKQVGKKLTATTVVVTATQAAIRVFLRTLTATSVVVTASMVRRVNLSLSVTVGLAATVTKSIAKRLTATVSALGSLVAQFLVPLIGPFAAAVAIQDVVEMMATVNESVSPSVSVSDASGTDASVSESQSPSAAMSDAEGTTLEVDDLLP